MLNKLLLTILIFITAQPVFSNSFRAKPFKYKYKASKYSLCNNNKLSPINYLQKYQITKIRFDRFNKDLSLSPFESWKMFLKSESKTHKNNDSEICEWNKFLMTDFIFYHEQDQSIFGKNRKILFLKLRDHFYKNWLVQLDNKTSSLTPNIVQKEITDIKHKAREFEFLTNITNLINHEPEVIDQESHALNDVFNLLEAKSVFNGIFSKLVLKTILDDQILATSKCMLNSLDDASGENIWMLFKQCSQSEKIVLFILGVYSSQRMYLIRDFKEQLFKNISFDKYAQASELINITSELYFKMETYGHEFGKNTLYPTQYSASAKSFKPYHFYSVAFIAMYLKHREYSNDIIRKVSTHYAKKYKQNIEKIGILYNILLLQPLRKGTVGDVKQVLLEQNLGASFGIQIGEL